MLLTITDRHAWVLRLDRFIECGESVLAVGIGAIVQAVFIADFNESNGPWLGVA